MRGNGEPDTVNSKLGRARRSEEDAVAVGWEGPPVSQSRGPRWASQGSLLCSQQPSRQTLRWEGE